MNLLARVFRILSILIASAAMISAVFNLYGPLNSASIFVMGAALLWLSRNPE